MMLVRPEVVGPGVVGEARVWEVWVVGWAGVAPMSWGWWGSGSTCGLLPGGLCWGVAGVAPGSWVGYLGECWVVPGCGSLVLLVCGAQWAAERVWCCSPTFGLVGRGDGIGE